MSEASLALSVWRDGDLRRDSIDPHAVDGTAAFDGGVPDPCDKIGSVQRWNNRRRGWPDFHSCGSAGLVCLDFALCSADSGYSGLLAAEQMQTEIKRFYNKCWGQA